jgi:GT2 family glycosyltransferase
MKTFSRQAMVRQLFPRAHLIANRENVGFARANNQATQENLSYVLLPNPDTKTLLGYLANSYRFH